MSIPTASKRVTNTFLINILYSAVDLKSADPKSPYNFDQAQLYSKKQFKPAWFTLPEIKANSKKLYHPSQ